jgi:hypothetical protein
MQKKTHENQGGIQVFVVFLYEVAVVVVGFAIELIVELDAGVAIGSSLKMILK